MVRQGDGQIDVERLDRETDVDVDGELKTAIAVASRAFWDDPLFNFFAKDLLAQHKNLPGFFGAALRDCADHGEVWVARSGAAIAGVAGWLPPGVLPADGGTREMRQLLRSGPSMARGRNRRTGLKFLKEMSERHPHHDHWYLAVLAADPGHQRRGVGGALLEPVLQRADESGVPTYLETQTEANLVYYRRFGFEVVDQFSIDDSPPVWLMNRDPR